MINTSETITQYVLRLRQGGMPIAEIAATANVDKLTVRKWMDGGSIPNDTESARLVEIRRVLDPIFKGRYHLLFRVMRIKTPQYPPLIELLSAQEMDVQSIEGLISRLKDTIDGIERSEARKGKNPFKTRTGRNGVIDDAPVAILYDL